MKISILEIFKWLAKFAGHILLYRLINRFVFGYNILFFKVKEGYYLKYGYIEKGYKIYSLIYKEDEEVEKRLKENLKYCGFIKNDENSRTLQEDLKYCIEQEQKRKDQLTLRMTTLEESLKSD